MSINEITEQLHSLTMAKQSPLQEADFAKFDRDLSAIKNDEVFGKLFSVIRELAIVPIDRLDQVAKILSVGSGDSSCNIARQMILLVVKCLESKAPVKKVAASKVTNAMPMPAGAKYNVYQPPANYSSPSQTRTPIRKDFDTSNFTQVPSSPKSTNVRDRRGSGERPLNTPPTQPVSYDDAQDDDPF